MEGPVFPREHLVQGEVVLFETRPHLGAFLLPTLAAGVVMLVVILPMFLVPILMGGFRMFADVVLVAILLLLLVSAVLPLLTQFLRYGRTAYAVTNQRVLMTTGIIGRTVVQCRHDRIQNITFHQGVVGRLLGAGNLIFSTAGLGGGAVGVGAFGTPMPMWGGNIVFMAVPDPMGTKRVVDEFIEQARRVARVEELREFSAAAGIVAAVAPAALPTTTVPPAASTGDRFCPFCGTPRVPGGSHCGNCGTRLPG